MRVLTLILPIWAVIHVVSKYLSVYQVPGSFTEALLKKVVFKEKPEGKGANLSSFSGEGVPGWGKE